MRNSELNVERSVSLERIAENSDSMTSETLGGRGSEREFKVRRKRMSCSRVVGLKASIERAARRQRSARRYFSSSMIRRHEMNVGAIAYFVE